MLRTLLTALVLVGVAAATAAAQTATTTQPTTTSSNPNEGAFDKLSPGNQKIARALYEGQAQPSGSTTTTTNPLSLDDIAAMKQSGKGWGVVFKEMKASGQIPPDAKNLGQLVSGKYQPQSTSGSTTITSASGKSQTTGKSGKGHFDDSASGGSQGSSGVSSGSGKGYGHGSSSGPSASAGRGENSGHGGGRGK